MLVILTWVAENSYISPPQMISHSIFGLFILEDQQIELQAQISSCPPCLVTFSRLSHHGWLMGTLMASSIGTPSPLKREIHWKCLSVVVGHLVPWLLTSPFLISTFEASSSKPCIHSLMLYATAGVCFVFIVPQEHPGPLALVLFHNNTCNVPLTFQYSAYHFVYLSLSPSPINWTGQAESNNTCIIKMNPLF